MTISDLISKLEAVKDKCGDLTVEIINNKGVYTDLDLVEVRKPDEFPPSVNIKRLDKFTRYTLQHSNLKSVGKSIF